MEYYMKVVRIKLNDIILTRNQQGALLLKMFALTNERTEVRFGYDKNEVNSYVDYVVSSNSLFELINFNANVLEMFRKASKNNFELLIYKTFRVDKSGNKHEIGGNK